jgi:hypothetical protein
MSSIRKFNNRAMKLLYTGLWGATSAFTGALVSSRFTLSLADWAIFSSLMAATALIVSEVMTGDLRTSVNTLKGGLFAVIAGGLLGSLIWVCEVTNPAVFTGALGVAALSLTIWAVRTQKIGLTAYSRGSANWAIAVSIAMAALSILTGGLFSSPTLQPILGALLGLWAVFLGIAFIDQTVSAPTAKS